ncbi:AsmA family protein [Telluribacter humicola]|uniref:hypothetical protein n=1 Tax=Telluribacter humicola TaxID=1720261 RepID=UPI001A97815E|nr:hypothetical protein [Telluribacter humicola]
MSDLKEIITKRWIIWSVGIVGGIVLLVLLASWVLPGLLKEQLDSSLKESVRKASDGLYSISYSDLSVNILLGNAGVSDVMLRSDSTVYKRLLEQKKAPDQVASVQTDRLSLEGVSILKLLLFKSLDIDEIRVESPNVTLAVDKKPYNTNRPKKSPYEIINQVLQSIHIDRISFTSVDFTYINNNGEKSKKNHLEELYLDVSDFRLNEETAQDTSRVLYAQQIEIRLKGLTLDAGNDHYTFSMKELALSSRDSTIKVQNVHYKPRHGKDQYSKVIGISKDRYDFKFENIVARRVDVRRFLMRQQLFAEVLEIDKGLMDIYRDRNYPDPEENQTGRYPHQLLKQAKFVVCFDTVRVRGTEVYYGERSEKTGLRGIIKFTGTQGTITNLTNDTATIARRPYCRVRAYTRFMGASRLNAYFNFNMASDNGTFNCGGSMRDFSIKQINPVTRALAKASVESGQLNLLKFQMQANSYESHITMQMLYNNLEVNVLKQDDESGKLEKRSLLSNLLNGLIIKNNNPSGDGPARVADVTVKRQPSDSFFNLIWQSILASIKDVVSGEADKPETEKDKDKQDQKKEDDQKKKGFFKRLFN